MGLSQFPSIAEGLLPVLAMNTIFSLALLKNMVRSVFHVVGAIGNSSDFEEDHSFLDDGYLPTIMSENAASERRLTITQFKSLCGSSTGRGSGRKWPLMECCVCLCGFEADQEVSELSCKHFFHKGCLDKWFGNKHTSCPLCRSIE